MHCTDKRPFGRVLPLRRRGIVASRVTLAAPILDDLTPLRCCANEAQRMRERDRRGWQLSKGDSSPNRHASTHAQRAGHPLIRSLEPGEDWSFCFLDDVGIVIPQVRGATRIPSSPPGR